MWPAYMTEPEPSPEDSRSPAVAPADAGVVLVVDDEPAILDSLTKIFRREGLEVLDRDRRRRPGSSCCASTASACCSPT